MARSRGSYPHPVVDASDDASSDFIVRNVSMGATAGTVVVTFEVELSDGDLRTMQRTRQIGISIYVVCSATFLAEHREPRMLRDLGARKTYELEMKQSELLGRAEFDVHLIAAERIDGYRLNAQSAAYDDSVFAIETGDVLADGGSFAFDVDKWFDPLNPPIDSCFEFFPDEAVKKGMQVLYDDEQKIRVRMAPKTYETFNGLNARPEILIGLVALPALADALNTISTDDADTSYGSCLWFRSLKTLLKKHGVEGMTPLEQAQALLENPTDRALSVVVDVMGDDE